MPSQKEYDYVFEEQFSSESEEEEDVHTSDSLDDDIRSASRILSEMRDFLCYQRSDILAGLSIEHIVDLIHHSRTERFTGRDFVYYRSANSPSAGITGKKVCLEEWLEITRPVLNDLYHILKANGVFTSNACLENFVILHSNTNGYILV